MPKRSRPIAISTKRPSSRRCKSRISTIVPTEQGISCKGRLSGDTRSEEHTSELQSRLHLVCRLLLEKKKSSPHTASRNAIALTTLADATFTGSERGPVSSSHVTDVDIPMPILLVPVYTSIHVASLAV